MSVKNFTKQFSEILKLAEQARYDAYKSVNAELVNLYWQVGEYISKKVQSTEWGMNIVDNLSEYLEKKAPDLRGFDRRGLYRMKQFYETYNNFQTIGITTILPKTKKVPTAQVTHIKKSKNIKVSPLVTQLDFSNLSSIKGSLLTEITWSNNLLILSNTSSDEENILFISNSERKIFETRTRASNK
jgi:hypothetical protein